MKILKIIFASTVFLLSCTRGETYSVDQIYNFAKARYEDALTKVSRQSDHLDPELESTVKDLVNTIDLAIEKREMKFLLEGAERISGLVSKAGYTTRPALSELVMQLRELGKLSNGNEPRTAQLKLIASRVYNLVASELETTRFRL